jgi:hypothetical protein
MHDVVVSGQFCVERKLRAHSFYGVLVIRACVCVCVCVCLSRER